MTFEPPWPVPADWRWCRFGEVARVASNLVDPADYAELPHVAPNHIESATGRLLPYRTVAEDAVISAKHRFFPGQVLYSKIRPYLAKVVVAEFEGLCSADMYPIESELDSRFLKWWMLTREFTRRAAGEQARTVLPKINVRALSGLPVPVPPPTEQRRIVAILEDHLSRLDAAAGYLTRVDRKLDALLLSRISAKLFDVRGRENVTLANLLDASIGGVWGSEPGAEQVDVRVIRVTELKAGGRIVPGSAAHRSVAASQLMRRELHPGDLLLEKSGGGPTQPVGRIGMIDHLDESSVCSNFMQLLRPNGSVVVARFLFWYLHGFYLRGGTGPMQKASTNIRNLKSSEYLQLSIGVPGLADQALIAADIDALSVECERLRRDSRALVTRGSALRDVLLGTAFAGKLPGYPRDHRSGKGSVRV